MKKYITLFSLAVSVVGLAITIDRGDWFLVFVISVGLIQILLSKMKRDMPIRYSISPYTTAFHLL